MGKLSRETPPPREGEPMGAPGGVRGNDPGGVKGNAPSGVRGNAPGGVRGNAPDGGQGAKPLTKYSPIL